MELPLRAIRELNDELKVQRCRLTEVRLKARTQTRMHDGVWIVGGDSNGDLSSRALADHLIKCAQRRERFVLDMAMAAMQ